MQAAGQSRIRRRTPAAAVKQEVLAFLADSLPAGWSSQPLSAGSPGAAADILILSPRGRCHFVFVQAPADRWWDGGEHCVPAEGFSTEGLQMARRLRAAGHKTRAIRGAQDLARALKAWGCPTGRAPIGGPARPGAAGSAAETRQASQPRPVLHLKGWGRRADA